MDSIPQVRSEDQQQVTECQCQSAINVSGTDLPVIEYQGKRVITFKNIDRVHQRPADTARRNFRQNRKRFIERKHFYHIDFSKKDEFRPLGIRIPPRGLILITERGYLLLVKSFTDDLAWEIQEQLIDGYFRVKEIVQRSTNPAPRVIRYQNFPPVFILDNALYTDTHHHYTYLQPGEDYGEWLDRYFRRYLTYHGYPLSPEQPDDPARIAYLILLSHAKSVSRQHITYQGAESSEYFSRVEQDFIAAALDTGLKSVIADAISDGERLPHA